MIRKLGIKVCYLRHHKLAAIQVFTFISLVALAIACVRLYHHQTPDSFLPFGTYLLSLRLAVPPVVGLFSSYFLLFMGGVTLADAPKKVVAFLRNVFFQVKWMMLMVSGTAFTVSGWIFIYTTTRPPPAYEQIIKQLLGGESDNGEIVSEQIAKLRDNDIPLGDQLGLVNRVFTERRKRNFDAKHLDGTTPRILVRALDSNHNDAAWKTHPLRWHALAEAYSMWMQAARTSVLSSADGQEWKTLRDQALKHYQNVTLTADWRATRLLKLSAEQNAGNVLLYTGDLEKAAEIYERILEDHRNLSTAGNLMAAYLMMKPARIEEAVKLGLDTREWALAEGKGIVDASAYSSLLSTLAFAKLLQSKIGEGRFYFTEAYDVVPDTINSYNLASALILEDRKQDALKILDKRKLPRISVKSQLKYAADLDDPLYYLLRGLALPAEDLVNRSVHILSYLERPTPASDIESMTEAACKTLMSDALDKLKTSAGPESSLLLIPEFQQLFMQRETAR